jgi:hypothetical protein
MKMIESGMQKVGVRLRHQPDNLCERNEFHCRDPGDRRRNSARSESIRFFHQKTIQIIEKVAIQTRQASEHLNSLLSVAKPTNKDMKQISQATLNEKKATSQVFTALIERNPTINRGPHPKHIGNNRVNCSSR